VRNFLNISVGSLAEVGYTLKVAHDVGLLSATEFMRLDEIRAEAGRTTMGLLRSLR
jgi:four helix bundle protein